MEYETLLARWSEGEQGIGDMNQLELVQMLPIFRCRKEDAFGRGKRLGGGVRGNRMYLGNGYNRILFH